jgi:hypothetical protein
MKGLRTLLALAVATTMVLALTAGASATPPGAAAATSTFDYTKNLKPPGEVAESCTEARERAAPAALSRAGPKRRRSGVSVAEHPVSIQLRREAAG